MRTLMDKYIFEQPEWQKGDLLKAHALLENFFKTDKKIQSFIELKVFTDNITEMLEIMFGLGDFDGSDYEFDTSSIWVSFKIDGIDYIVYHDGLDGDLKIYKVN